MSASPGLVADVSDTARWVAYHRALESDRPDALFRDPLARRLAGARGQRIAEEMPALLHGLTWALAVRTAVYDEWILEAVESGSFDAVLDVGAGLDARPYRLPLPASLAWIEADLPPLVRAKGEALSGERASCAIERVGLDLADGAARRALLARVAAAHARVLVVTEGVLEYLDEHAVRELSDDLRAHPAMRRWLLAVAAPDVVKRQMRTWSPVLGPARAEMRFAPAEGLAFFRRHGWSPRVARSCVVESRRLRREMRHAWLIRALSALSPEFRRRLEGAVHYAVMEPCAPGQ